LYASQTSVIWISETTVLAAHFSVVETQNSLLISPTAGRADQYLISTIQLLEKEMWWAAAR